MTDERRPGALIVGGHVSEHEQIVLRLVGRLACQTMVSRWTAMIPCQTFCVSV